MSVTLAFHGAPARDAGRRAAGVRPGTTQGWRDMADYQEYLGFMYTALTGLNKKEILLSETTDLVADLGLSSLEVMEFVEKIEDRFDISIPLNILPDVNTIGQLARKLQELNPQSPVR